METLEREVRGENEWGKDSLVPRRFSQSKKVGKPGDEARERIQMENKLCPTLSCESLVQMFMWK